MASHKALNTDVWSLIVKALKSIPDLQNLVSVSKQLKSAAEPRLYQLLCASYHFFGEAPISDAKTTSLDAAAAAPSAATPSPNPEDWKKLFVSRFLLRLNTTFAPKEGTVKPVKNEAMDMPLPGVSAVPSANPLALPGGFEWQEIDLFDEKNGQLKDVFHFLDENAIEDDDGLFRVHYDVQYLRRNLFTPSKQPPVFLGVRVASNNRMVAFVSAVPKVIRIFDQVQNVFSIQFLCIHKKLRGKKLARVLLREMVRRIQISTTTTKAIFALGVHMPFNLVTEARIFHSPIEINKLDSLGYRLKKTDDETLNLPSRDVSVGLRLMEPADYEAAWRFVSTKLQEFPVAQCWNLAEFVHYYSCKRMATYSYIIEDSAKAIKGFVSFYIVHQRALHEKDITIHSAMLDVVFGSDTVTKKQLAEDVLLIAAKSLKLDQLEVVETMDAAEYVDQVNFAPGSGRVYYYLHNWYCGTLQPPSWAVNEL